MDAFINDILKYNSLSIVGMEKNTGKTECLKYVLERVPLDKGRFAVTSIGVDGESVDQVTQTSKPEVFLREGMYFGTSEMHYRSRKLVSELIDVSDESTPLGRVVSAKALTRGKLLLSGPSTGLGLKRWIKEMRRFGIDHVIIDGALSRLSSASPAISESMVLTTGAAYSINLRSLVQKTAYVADMINLDLTTPANQTLLTPLENGVWTIDKSGILKEQKTLSSLSSQVQFDEMEQCATIYLAGALVDGFLEQVRQKKSLRGVEIVVRDFTKVFVSPQQFRIFANTGGKIHVLQKSKLIAICVNPTSPSGYKLDSDLLCKTLSESVTVPVYDLLKNDLSN